MNNRKISDVKKIAILLTVLFVISIIPLIALGIYDHPCADDFSFSAATRQALVQTRSPGKAVVQAFATVADRYMTWQGTYTSILFMALQPAVWSESFYMITPAIMLSAIIFSVLYLCRAVVVRCLHGTGSECAVISILMLSSMIQCIPDGTDSLYWFNGSVHYIIPTAAAFVMFGLLISVIGQPEKRKKLRLCMAVLCAFLTGGGNYVTGLAVVVAAAFLLLILLYAGRLKKHKAVCLPLFLYLVFFLVNAAAPGNAVRSSAIGGVQMNPVKSVLVSFRYALSWSIEEWLDWTIPVLLLLSVPFLWKVVKNSSFSFPCPIAVAALSYCLFASAFTPGLYAAGNINAPRIQNAIFLLLIVLLYVNTGYLLGWICRRFGQTREKDRDRGFLSSNQSLCAGAAFVMLVFGAGVTIVPNPDYYTATAACTELFSGEAAAYDAEMRIRNEVLNGPEENVTLAPLQHQPGLLFFSDITTDAADWTNGAMSRYYGKQSVVLRPEGQQ